MGAMNSKVSVTIPPSPTCFPRFEDEDELYEAVSKIGECHLQAVQIASWIGSIICPTYSSTIMFTAATYLLTFIIHRLATGSETEEPATSTPKSKSKRPNSNRATLESALIEAKVSEAIAKKSVSELQAKFYVIRSRCQRLVSKINDKEKLLEVVPAIQTCEEVLQLFADKQHILYTNPVVASPFLVPFAGIFIAVAELSLALIPSYEEHLAKEIALLYDTIKAYKNNCTKARISGLRFKPNQPESMLDAVAGGKLLESHYRMEDSFVSFKSIDEDPNPVDEPTTRVFSSGDDAVTAYKAEIEEKYNNFFNPVLKTVSEFQGFDEEKCSSDSDDEEGTSVE